VKRKVNFIKKGVLAHFHFIKPFIIFFIKCPIRRGFRYGF